MDKEEESLINNDYEIRGKFVPKGLLAPSLEEEEICAELLDILDFKIRRKFY